MKSNQKSSRTVLFAHNGPLYFDKEGAFYGVSFNDELRRRYLKLGDQVKFLMRTRPLPEKIKEKLTQIKNEKFSVVSVPNHLSFRGFLFSRKKRKRIIQKTVKESDIIVARLPSGNGFDAIKQAKKEKKPFIVEVVSCPFDALWNFNLLGKFLAIPVALRLKWVVKKAPFVIYVTSQFLQLRYPSIGHQINASNVFLLPPSGEVLENRLKKLNGIKSLRKITLGTIGAIDVPYKGQGLVIKALSRLKKKGWDLKYLLAGSGDQTALEKLAIKLDVKEQVVFCGPVKHEKIGNWLDEIDLYVHPSNQEGLPRAVIEAMSRGCNVIGSTTGGIPELLESTFVFKRKKLTDLVEKIETINKDLLIMNAERNFNKALEFTIDVLEEKRNKFYQEFLVKNNFL